MFHHGQLELCESSQLAAPVTQPDAATQPQFHSGRGQSGQHATRSALLSIAEPDTLSSTTTERMIVHFLHLLSTATRLACRPPHRGKCPGSDATAAPYCPTSVEKLITASLCLDGVGTAAKHKAPSGAVNKCLLGPHRGPVQLNSDIFSVFIIQRSPPVEQRPFRGRVARSGS